VVIFPALLRLKNLLIEKLKMKLKSRINKRLNESSNWILNSPESLTLLMLMGTGLASLFFSVFTIAMFFYKKYIFVALFGFFVFGSVKQFIKLFKSYKKVGLKNALGGFTAREFVWHRNKNGGKLNGISGYTSDEVGSRGDEEENGRFGKEIRHIYQQPERLSKNVGNRVRTSNSSSKKSRN